MRWPEIDLGRCVWEIPGSRTKNAKPHTVHLSEVASSILKDLEERQKNGSDLVFTTRKDHPVSGFSKAKRQLDELSGVEDWRLHDLRRTFVSRCVDFGLDATVVDRVLNHVASSTMSTVARVYQQSEMIEQRRHALEAWSDWVIKSAGGE
jgi:integrase